MTKKLLKQLVSISFKDNNFDQKNVLAIADKLDRKGLKKYIKALKSEEKHRSVFIDMPFDENSEEIKELQSIFLEKKLIVRKDPSLLLGMRITNNDDVIEMDLKDKLDDIMEAII